MKCLLIIDVQNGFVSERTKHVLPAIYKKIDEFKDELIISTKFINEPNSPYQSILNWYRLADTPETDLISKIEEESNYIFEKNINSSWCKQLETVLKDNNITEVYLAGIDTDCCVLKTATDLFENGIRPMVLTKCCASNGGEESHKAALKVMERTIGRNQLI